MSLKHGINIISAVTSQRDHVLESIVQIQASCILNDRTMATFTPPLSHQRMMRRWADFLAEVTDGTRIIIVCVSPVADRSPPDEGLKPSFPGATWPILDDTLEVSGVISLSLPKSETGPFRALVQNLFVHPLHRQRGIATTLLAELEAQALLNKRWSLMLDTTVGTPAVKLYEGLGWVSMGVIPDYGYRPTGTEDEVELADEIWFYKDLRS